VQTVDPWMREKRLFGNRNGRAQLVLDSKEGILNCLLTVLGGSTRFPTFMTEILLVVVEGSLGGDENSEESSSSSSL